MCLHTLICTVCVVNLLTETGKDRYRAVEVPVENLHVLPPGQVPTAKKVRTAAEMAKEITPVEIFNPDAFRGAQKQKVSVRTHYLLC